MPFYDYHCTDCHHAAEHMHPMSKTITICPKCGGNNYKKLIGNVVGLIFKGTGFYQNDYPKNNT